MKFLVILLFTFCVCGLTKADGGMPFFIYKFTIQTTDFQKVSGFSYVPDGIIKQDSMQSTAFLLKIFNEKYDGAMRRDSFTFYKTELTYKHYNNPNYTDEDGNIFKFKIIQLTDKKSLAINQIKEIKIDTFYDHHWNPGIYYDMNLTASDSIWMKNKPIDSIEFHTQLCIFKIYIHQYSNKVTKQINLIKSKQNELDSLENILENEYLTEEQRDAIYNEIDKKENIFFEWMKGFRSEKIIVIEDCTC